MREFGGSVDIIVSDVFFLNIQEEKSFQACAKQWGGQGCFWEMSKRKQLISLYEALSD
jgi:hypothetical protein